MWSRIGHVKEISFIINEIETGVANEIEGHMDGTVLNRFSAGREQSGNAEKQLPGRQVHPDYGGKRSF